MKELPFKMIVETDIEKYRHSTFWTKEPETLAWLDSFEEDHTFADVGANIGIYSLYAASRGINVCAFEPHPYNYVRLLDNILLNGFININPMHSAIGENSTPVKIYISDKQIGASGTQTGSPIDEHGKDFKPEGVLSILRFRLGDFGGSFNHIKIDVDGHEKDIIAGMKENLCDVRLKSVLVEVNPDCSDVDKIKECFRQFGFTTDNPFNSHPNHSRIRRKKEGIKAENIIFTRRTK